LPFLAREEGRRTLGRNLHQYETKQRYDTYDKSNNESSTMAEKTVMANDNDRQERDSVINAMEMVV
jgi:hypothetical protein